MFAEAEAQARAILKEDPDRETPWIVLASCYNAAGDTIKRDNHLRIASKISPNSGMADLLLAGMRRIEGLDEEAKVHRERGTRLWQEWLVGNRDKSIYTGQRGSFFDLEGLARTYNAKFKKFGEESAALISETGTVCFNVGSRSVFSSGGAVPMDTPIIRFNDRLLVHSKDAIAGLIPALKMLNNPKTKIPRFILLPYPSAASPLEKSELEALAAEINMETINLRPGEIRAGGAAEIYDHSRDYLEYAIYVGTAGEGAGSGVFRPPVVIDEKDDLTNITMFNATTSLALNTALHTDVLPPKLPIWQLPFERPRFSFEGPFRSAEIDSALPSDFFGVGIRVNKATLKDPARRQAFVRRIARGLDRLAPEPTVSPLDKLSGFLETSTPPLGHPLAKKKPEKVVDDCYWTLVE